MWPCAAGEAWVVMGKRGDTAGRERAGNARFAGVAMPLAPAAGPRLDEVENMRGRLADLFRGLAAPWYWNARKFLFVARGRRGQCPCQNESDSGLPGETRCEAVTYWVSPRRFARRVCPLLKENAAGEWRCSVRPEEVRPFWVRMLGMDALAVAAAIACVGGGLWVTMRVVGYEVGLRQIFWPPAWSGLRLVRADFFRRQSADFLREGRFREALASLSLASELAPEDYDTGMLLAQVDHLVRPERADFVYRRLYELHPARRAETSRVWLRSLLSRAQMVGAGELARRRLVDSPEEWPVWLHALLTAARWERDYGILEAAARDDQAPAAARALLDFEVRLRRADFGEARRMLVAEPIGATPYAVVHRIERLLEFGDGLEALLLLRERATGLGQRDIVRLTLAAHAVARNRAVLEREVRGLLARRDEEGEVAVNVVALHLVRHPNDALLALCRDAAESWAREGGGAARHEALAALYCAIAVGGRTEWLPAVRAKFPEADLSSASAQQRIEQVFAQPITSPLMLLGVVRPLSLELNYAILERVLATR
ncbi:MAG: hypothetical protein C0502_06355 [Opitutus sp.]|nr:hypothetical protein [Opitutus sp.]